MLPSAIANLLQNDFKFTQPGRLILLTAGLVAEHVLIEVADEYKIEPLSIRDSTDSGAGIGLR